MTVHLEDEQDDDLLTSLSNLRRWDVSQSRARQLRRRCHARLQGESPATESVRMVDRTSFRQIAITALGVAWCLAYIVEIIRYTAAVYAHFGTQ